MVQPPLDRLPDLVLEMLLDLIPPKDLCTMAVCARGMREVVTDEKLWKRLCLQDWPIASGNVSGLVHILSSLVDRQMSAFLALATYDPKSETFCLSYGAPVIARARRGEKLLLRPPKIPINVNAGEGNDERPGGAESTATSPSDHPTARLVDEQLSPVTERLRFRRVPEELIDIDPRELYARELFLLPLDRRNRAPLFRLGEEVEVQWRSRVSEGYAWWRGIVGGIGLLDFTDGMLLVPSWELTNAREVAAKAAKGTDWSLEIEPDPRISTDEGSFEDAEGDSDVEMADVSRHPSGRVSVLFPHYPTSSRWHVVFSSTLGVPEQNPPLSGHLGWVGGVRRVTCSVHRELWKRNFVQVTWYNQSNGASAGDVAG
ncbi:hypothetical protein HDU67_009221 [Dinochytrium kinnereticum]|nr:hypothetical protein HDU67_009221 [Dinochytrium kinnereticum]